MMTNSDLIIPKAVLTTVALGFGSVIAANGIQVETQTCSETECISEICSVNESLGSETIIDERAEFQELVREWRDNLPATSSASQMAAEPAYRKIIGMGPAAIPMILAQLKSEGSSPGHWFIALASITRANPVPPESRGRLQEMAKAWLAWGETKGYV
jgi:hypothetical protein